MGESEPGRLRLTDGLIDYSQVCTCGECVVYERGLAKLPIERIYRIIMRGIAETVANDSIDDSEKVRRIAIIANNATYLINKKGSLNG